MAFLSDQETEFRGAVKVVVELPPDAWHGFKTETIWAEPTKAPGHFRLRSIPIYAYGLSYDDLFSTTTRQGKLYVQSILERGGHSTYRVFLEEGFTFDDFERQWSVTRAFSACAFERAGRLIAIDVPPEADIYDVYAELEAGADAGRWDLQEGHVGHRVN